MNCQSFTDLCEEFLDGTLAPREQAQAAAHLASCEGCREQLRQRQQFGARLTKELRDAADTQRFPAHMAERIAREWQREGTNTAQASGSGILHGLLGHWLLRWAAGSIAVVLAALLAGRFIQEAARVGPAGQGGVLVELSYVTPIHAFQRTGEYVSDRMVFETVRVNTRLELRGRAPESSRQ